MSLSSAKGFSDDCPGKAVNWIKRQTGVKGNRGRFRYFRSWDWFCWYCVTPPVIPPWEYDPQTRATNEALAKWGEVRPERCIVCGKVHITSEDCGREPPERKTQNEKEGFRQDDGYKLQAAENMGLFDDV